MHCGCGRHDYGHEYNARRTDYVCIPESMGVSVKPDADQQQSQETQQPQSSEGLEFVRHYRRREKHYQKIWPIRLPELPRLRGQSEQRAKRRCKAKPDDPIEHHRSASQAVAARDVIKENGWKYQQA